MSDRPDKHKQDYRFRGVYLLLVNLLPLEDAEMLREELIQYAPILEIIPSAIGRLRVA